MGSSATDSLSLLEGVLIRRVIQLNFDIKRFFSDDLILVLFSSKIKTSLSN